MAGPKRYEETLLSYRVFHILIQGYGVNIGIYFNNIGIHKYIGNRRRRITSSVFSNKINHK